MPRGRVVRGNPLRTPCNYSGILLVCACCSADYVSNCGTNMVRTTRMLRRELFSNLFGSGACGSHQRCTFLLGI